MYLIHTTSPNNYKSILDHGYLMPDIQERYDEGLYNESTHNVKEVPMEGGQFPGVYFSLSNQEMIDKDPLYDGHFKNEVILVFPIDLLEQNNYHINLDDQFGLINQKTIFPETIHKNPCLINKIINFPGNEVVFHDPINIHGSISITYPFEIPLIEIEKPIIDKNSKPFYAFNFLTDEENIIKNYHQDYDKYKDLYTRLCSLIKSKEGCKEHNKDIISLERYMYPPNEPNWKYYYNNRNKQNLDNFKRWNAFDYN